MCVCISLRVKNRQKPKPKLSHYFYMIHAIWKTRKRAKTLNKLGCVSRLPIHRRWPASIHTHANVLNTRLIILCRCDSVSSMKNETNGFWTEHQLTTMIWCAFRSLENWLKTQENDDKHDFSHFGLLILRWN